jgi:hypothetical protein
MNNHSQKVAGAQEEAELLELMEKNIDSEILERLREMPERTDEHVLVGDYYVSSQGTGTGYANESGN